MNTETVYFEPDIPADFERRGVLAWLYWLQFYMGYWFGLPSRFEQEQSFACEGAHQQGHSGNRHRRRVDEHFDKKTVPPARNIKHFRTFLPRGLSLTQYQERLSRVSIYGRIFMYRIPNVVPLHRRMLFTRRTPWAFATVTLSGPVGL